MTTRRSRSSLASGRWPALRAVAGSVLAGIDEAPVRALAKLEQVLPARLRARFTSLVDTTTSLT